MSSNAGRRRGRDTPIVEVITSSCHFKGGAMLAATASPRFPGLPIRVVVADDHSIVRAGIRILLATAPDIAVVGEAENGLEALDAVRRLGPHVAVLDAEMPVMGGLSAAAALATGGSPTRTIVLLTQRDGGSVARALPGGAAGCLSKSTADRDLVGAIRLTAAGWTDQPRSGIHPAAPPPRCADGASRQLCCTPLSPNERAVLLLVAQGCTTRQVGMRLLLSDAAVQAYRARIARTLGLHHRADYLRFCLRLGLHAAS